MKKYIKAFFIALVILVALAGLGFVMSKINTLISSIVVAFSALYMIVLVHLDKEE
jgi:hypothetical protein